MQIMCIRKGKRLVARILPFLAPEQAADVLMATARNLPFLIKKDAQDEVRFQRLGGLHVSSGWPFLPFLGGCQRFYGRNCLRFQPGTGKHVQLPTEFLSPQVLPCLLRPFSHVLYHLPLGTVTSLVQQLTNLPQSAAAPTNLHLTAVLQNKVLLIPTPSQPWELPQ